MKALVLLLCSFLLLTACSSSSSSSSSKAECFNGAYNVVFAAETTGHTECPDLTAKPTQWNYVANADGTLVGPEPTGSTPKTVIADENTCKLDADFETTAPATGCGVGDSYFFQLTFDAKGLSGTYTAIGCVAGDPDAGATGGDYFSCTYPVTGTKL